MTRTTTWNVCTLNRLCEQTRRIPHWCVGKFQVLLTVGKDPRHSQVAELVYAGVDVKAPLRMHQTYRFESCPDYMNFNYKKTAILLLIIAAVTVTILALTNDDREEYFKPIELPTTNTVVNTLDHLHYYDTILAVGMDGAGLNGVTVVLNDMTDAARNQFNGELKAHIRLYNGVYYLFVGALNRSEAIQVMAHEIVHIQQYQSGELVYENEEVKWQGEIYTLEEEYERRPWERDAFDKQSSIESIILNTLY
jgi:hypothetical protein